MTTTSQKTALRRMHRITAAALGQEVSSLAPAATRASAFVQAEGEAIARASAWKVNILLVGGRGVDLAARPLVMESFKRHSLEVSWSESEKDVPDDVNVIVTVGAPVSGDLVRKLSKLRLVAAAFTGYDHIDVAACHNRGITVVNVPNYSTDATAELAIGLILSHLRRLPACHQVVKEGGWQCPPQEDLQSKTIGIVGTGKIGVRLAELFKAFKVRAIMGTALEQDPGFLAAGGTYVESLAAVFLEADIVCIALPLTELTKGLITRSLLSLLRPESILVNVGRGDVVDEEALAEMLLAKQFRAALDVYSIEPLPDDHPLRKVPTDSLIMTPHVGYQSAASLEKRFAETVKNILAFLAGQPLHVV